MRASPNKYDDVKHLLVTLCVTIVRVKFKTIYGCMMFQMMVQQLITHWLTHLLVTVMRPLCGGHDQ